MFHNGASSTLYIAAAGSGKTTLLVRKALSFQSGRVLLITYTDENTDELYHKFYELNSGVPANVSIKPWFTFLLEQYLRPYQGVWVPERISGIQMISGSSGLVNRNGRTFHSHTQGQLSYYLDRASRVYSDKIAKFAIEMDKKNNGEVIKRLARAYKMILVDEVQDMAGYDLDILKQISENICISLFAGDPRQDVCETHSEPKYKKYSGGNIVNFFKEVCVNTAINTSDLKVNHRCIPQICELSNLIFPREPKSTSDVENISGEHEGLFFVRESQIDAYINSYQAMQLRYSVREKRVNIKHPVINFGKAKGHAFKHVLIFPTGDMVKWLPNHDFKLKDATRSKLYVAVTRAIRSVAFVVPSNSRINSPEISYWVQSKETRMEKPL